MHLQKNEFYQIISLSKLFNFEIISTFNSFFYIEKNIIK